MSGWDVSSTPTWGPQDGPEETQSFASAGDGAGDFGSQEFTAQDFGRPAPSSPAGGFPESHDTPPPEFFAPEYGQQEQHDVTPGGYPRRTPGRSLQGLPRREASEARGRHSSAQPGSYGRDDAFSQEGPFGQDTAYGQDTGYGRDSAFGQDSPFSQDAPFSQDPGYNQDSAYGIGWGGNGQSAPPAGRDGAAPDGGWGRTASPGAAPWEERSQQDPFYPDLDSSAAVGGQDYPRQAPGRPATADHDWGRQDDQARPGQDYAGQDYPSQDYSGQDYPSQDFAGQDYPSQDFAGQDFAGQEYPAQADRGLEPPAGFDRRGVDQTARMDPALQDFFVPQSGANGYQDPWGEAQGGPGSGGNGVRYRQGDDGWAEPARPQAARGGTGPRPAAGGGFDDEPRRLGIRSYIAIGAGVAVVIVVAFLALSRGGSTGSPPTAAGNPTTSTTSAASSAPPSPKATGSTSTSTAGSTTGGGTAATAAYVLSTPSKAGGFPKGSDPHFLSIATSTAAEVSSAVTEGKAGAVKGSPISAAYELPVAGQVVTFVGYQGTFTPAKVATVLASLGTDAHSYPAGAHGGIIGCANTKATATVTSGAVCVWASSSTIGVTEFFSATGPEALTASQSKGATDTVNIRGDVEAKSS